MLLRFPRFFPHLFLAPLGLIFVAMVVALMVLWIIALVDVCRRQFKTTEAKLLWIVILLLAHGIGAIIYLCVGRDQGVLPGQGPAA